MTCDKNNPACNGYTNGSCFANYQTCPYPVQTPPPLTDQTAQWTVITPDPQIKLLECLTEQNAAIISLLQDISSHLESIRDKV